MFANHFCVDHASYASIQICAVMRLIIAAIIRTRIRVVVSALLVFTVQ